MLLLILAFTAIGVVYCQNCPTFAAYKNDVSLINDLNGTFFKIYATTKSNVADCQKQTFTIGPNNNITGYIESPNFCLRMDNCDSSNPDYYQCDITPITSGVTTLPSPQKNSIKLVKRMGTGDNLCLLYAYCRLGEEGSYVLCRKRPQFLLTLWLQVIRILKTLLGLIVPVTPMKIVKQSNCIFLNTCPPRVKI